MVQNLDQLVFVDETSSDNRSVVPSYGYSLVNRRAVSYNTFLRGTRLNVIAAIDIHGLIDYNILTKSVSAADFNDFFVHDLLPHCNPYPGPRSVIVMDNASIHRKPFLIPLCEALGVLIIFLSPYSPDFNPIELSFRCLKQYLVSRRFAYRIDPLSTLIDGLATLYFNHSHLFAEAGYTQHFFDTWG